jgi:hypothetical protein
MKSKYLKCHGKHFSNFWLNANVKGFWLVSKVKLRSTIQCSNRLTDAHRAINSLSYALYFRWDEDKAFVKKDSRCQ